MTGREWYVEGELIQVAGTAHGLTPGYEMTDAEVLAFQEEHRAREARRVPMGFRAECSGTTSSAGGFPAVGRL